MKIIQNLSELKEYYSDDNLLEEYGGTSKFKYIYTPTEVDDKKIKEKDDEVIEETTSDTIKI